MKLTAFRIKNFRSIVDTDWCSLSADNVTALIGQNESGKSSILDALNAFWTQQIDPDDLRSDGGLAEIFCRFEIGSEQWTLIRKTAAGSIPLSIFEIVQANKGQVTLVAAWNGDKDHELTIRIADPAIESAISDAINEERATAEAKEQLAAAVKDVVSIIQGKPVTEEIANTETPTPAPSPKVDGPKKKAVITNDEFANHLFNWTPDCVFFEEETSLLPNSIDISQDGKYSLIGPGNVGAQNFLSVAGLQVSDLLNQPQRIVESSIEKANSKITGDFQSFWTQVIGKNTRIRLKCELKYHDNKVAEKAGHAYLAFWILDGNEKLYPKQRSKGVRWFLSFYLQLTASASTTHNRIFLLDEPGANLHGKAQEDVLRLMERIKTTCQVIFATHSPYLVPMDKLYRVLGVQRDDVDNDLSPTRVIETHKLATASVETLTPVYTWMGVNATYQQVIPKSGNVILEELSGFYYLQAFWKLTGAKKKVYFLPANGADNIPRLAYLFLGWGIDSIVVVDDDNRGRSVFNELKKNIYLDDDTKAKSKLLKIVGANGIEDIFSPADFRTHVLMDSSIEISSSNSEFVKRAGVSKIVTAVKFMLAVDEQKILLNSLSDESQKKIKSLVTEIEDRIS